MLRSYLRLATRVLLRRKFFTAVSLFGISFTLVVLTVVVALLDHVLAPLPPETRLERTLAVYQMRFSTRDGRRGRFETSFLLMDRYMRGIPGVERMSLLSTQQEMMAYANGEPMVVTLKRTDADYWKILDFAFLEGGPFTEADVENASLVAVITEAMRRRFFGHAPALGETIEVDGQRFHVVGVVSNVSRLRPIPYSDFWVPHTTDKSGAHRRQIAAGGYVAAFLARSPADLPAIRAEFASRMQRVPIHDDPVAAREGVDRLVAHMEAPAETVARLYAGDDFMAVDEEGRVRLGRFFGALAALAFLFMLLPTLNLVNLNVSRVLERASEIGVRKAFGATSRALVGQFVVENVVLTIVGGLLGFVGAYAVLGALTGSEVIPYAQFRMNGRVFLSGLALSVFFGVLSGAYPAWRMSRLNPVDALKGGAR